MHKLNRTGARLLRKKQFPILILLILIIIYLKLTKSLFLADIQTNVFSLQLFQYKNENLNIDELDIDEYDRAKMLNSPLIFIGGYPRSGTTLMRAILDVHPSVSCGPETKIIPPLLSMIKKYKTGTFMNEFNKLGYKNVSIDSATALFIYHIMENHIRTAERLCAKDPDILYYMEYLHRLFPKAKFVYMVRDGKAAAFSLMSKLEKYKTPSNYVKYLNTWNTCNSNFYRQCINVGAENCMMVRYESLVMFPKQTMVNVTRFLGLSWTEDFLKHDEFIRSKKVAVSETEWSSQQIKNPIYNRSLLNWVGHIKLNRSMIRFAYMLNVLDYKESRGLD